MFNNPYQNIANSVNDFLRNSVDRMKNFIELAKPNIQPNVIANNP